MVKYVGHNFMIYVWSDHKSDLYSHNQILHTYVCIIIASGRVSSIMTMPTGLEWTPPSNVPSTCFPQYIISLSNNPTTTLIVNSTMASFADLIAVGFPSCVSQDLTVTPISAISRARLTNSSATVQVSIINAGTCTHCCAQIPYCMQIYTATGWYSYYRFSIVGAKCQCSIKYGSEN